MSRGKLLLIVVFLLGAIAADASAELVVHYPFDDGTANDRAYYYEDADGTFFGDAKVIDDANRGAVLDLDGVGDYVKVLNNQVAEFSTESFSYAFWCKTNFTGDWYCFWKGIDYTGVSEPDDLHGVNIWHDNDSPWVRFSLYNYGGVDNALKSRTDVPDTNCITGQWIHIACVRDASIDELRFYINGELEPPGGGANPATDECKDISNPGYLYIGCNDRGYPPDTNSSPSYFWNGQFDDFRVYNHALSEEEIDKLANDYVDPNLASDPSPPDGAENECADLVLSWTEGENAVTHDVYVGTDGSDVRDANTADTGIYKGNYPTNSYNAGLLMSLEEGQTYYWRIDEVNPGPPVVRWKGNVWKFRINDGKAHSPDPADDATMVSVEQILSWGAGCHAASHDVYFGTDFNDVNDGTTVAYQGNQGLEDTDFDPCEWDPCGLEYSTWYHWRIDEVNGPNTWEGEVWSFRTGSPIVDANLRVWYKFDETAGTDAIDSSGREYDGIVYGEGSWDANGYYDGCIWFDDNGNIVVPMGVLEQIEGQITITCWINNATSEHDDNVICAAGWGEGLPYMRVSVPDDDHDVYWRAGNDSNDVMGWDRGNPAAWKDSWNHFAFVKNEDEGKMKIYLNGLQVAESTKASPGTLSGVRDQRFKIAAETQDSSGYAGRIDEFRVYDRALSDEEIAGIFRGGDLGIAWGPDPYDGRTEVPREPNLIWKPGDYVAEHKVYFGTSWDDVNNMTDPCATRSPGQENYSPGVLILDTDYYWRVDEVNGPNTWKGTVWQFTVADFIMLDDFERYDKSNNLIWYTWYCKQAMPYGQRSGAYLSLSTDPVYNGAQAMRYDYETDDSKYWDQDYAYADACLPLDEIDGFQDWTGLDLRLVTIFYYGQGGNDTNDTEQMYMAVHNADGNYAEVRYGDHDGETMSDLKVEEWQRWDVPFVWFTDSNAEVSANVDFSSISSVYLGFGDKRNPERAGNGTVYFDDLRLNLAICKPEYGPAADFSGNCIVDVADIGKMGQQWLNHDVNFADDLGIEVQQPSEANLVGHYKLDEGTGSFAEDSSTNNYHGTLELTDEGGYSWVAGRDGNAVEFSGGRVYVNDNGSTPELRPANKVSVVAWVKIREDMSSARCVVKGRNDHESYEIEVDGDDTFIFQFRDGNSTERTRYDVNGTVWANDWIHLAGTYDGSSIACYVNGQLEDSKDIDNPYGLSQDPNGLAIGNKPRGDANDTPFEGVIDDVRIYDYGLSQAEVAWLATEGSGEFVLTSPVNLFSGEQPEVINLRDFAKVMDSWLDEKLWP